MDRVDALQVKNDRLEKEIMEMIDDLDFNSPPRKAELKRKIVAYSNVAFLLGVETGKES